MAQTIQPNVTHIAGILAGAMPKLGAPDRALALALYRELATGEPVSPGALAGELGRGRAEIETTLDRWPGVYRDDAGRIVGFWGLAIGEMPHRFGVEGRQLYTWCAWDALFIPGLIGRAAEVESRSPASGASVRLTVDPDGVRELMPKEAVVSMLAPTEAFDQDAIMSFCHFVHFFTSPGDAEAWIAEHPGTFLLSIDEAFELGRLTNRARFGDLLEATA